jgi:flagellar basal-body rod protein FlgF
LIGSTAQASPIAADEPEGMQRGLYIAASGMVAEQVRQDLLANDLANAATPGYKSDRATQRAFEEVLLANTRTGREVGPLGMGVEIDRQATDWRPQPARRTDEPLDFAIAGEGFFAVQGADGVRYTRNGRFTQAPDGTLATATGERVLGRGGGPVRVGADGTVPPAQLQVVLLDAPRKAGEGFVAGTPAGQAPAGTVRAGELEGSGADPARAMVDMIASLRAFEAGQRVIRTIDDTLGKAVNDVGRA